MRGSPPADRSNFCGRVLGPWRLGRLIGAGGFGAVYEAQHEAIRGRRAAVKVLHPHLSLQSDIQRRFLDEASAASRAEHENIIQVFDGGVDEDGLCYVVMELLSGRTLAQVVRKGPMGARQAADLGAQVAAALQAAHVLGIVHRDLKPENILLIERTHNPAFVKVLDFGIAKLHDADRPGTRPGTWLGTPDYMSPEQWQMLPDIDGRADLYALGIILFECLTGRRPFSSETVFASQQAHLHEPVPDPRARVAIEQALAQLVMRLMAKRREDRPGSAAEVAAALDRLQRRAGGDDPTVLAPAAGVPAPEDPPRYYRSTTGHGSGQVASLSPAPRRGRSAAVVLLLLGIGAAALVLHRGPPPAPPAQTTAVPPPPPAQATQRRELPPAALPEDMAVLPAGELAQGDGPRRRTVPVERFAIGRYEVSMGQFRAFARAAGLQGPLPWDGVPLPFQEIIDLPVNQVGRDLAERYCRWRYALWGGRLPTEIEWEYAARGGPAGRRLPFGEVMDGQRVNAGRRTVQLLPVRSLPEGASPQGALHLIGNVAEWVSGEGGARGGSAHDGLRQLSVLSRAAADPERGSAFIGFRCAASAQLP